MANKKTSGISQAPLNAAEEKDIITRVIEIDAAFRKGLMERAKGPSMGAQRVDDGTYAHGFEDACLADLDLFEALDYVENGPQAKKRYMRIVGEAGVARLQRAMEGMRIAQQQSAASAAMAASVPPAPDPLPPMGEDINALA